MWRHWSARVGSTGDGSFEELATVDVGETDWDGYALGELPEGSAIMGTAGRVGMDGGKRVMGWIDSEVG